MTILVLKGDNRIEITSWRNFCSHISRLQGSIENYNTLDANERFQKWLDLRDQELQKWQAQLKTKHRNPPIRIRDQSYLEFPDMDALMAFELAWS